MTTIRVPASSANLGPGFDALGLALSSYLEVTLGVSQPSDERHLAVRSYRAAGGTADIAVRADFAGGRGLGFSGAARVAGVMAARLDEGCSPAEARERALVDAAAMEGHADNVGASVLGGVVAVAGGMCVPVQVALDCRVVVWIPQAETSTKASRGLLPESVPFEDATFNVGRVALLVAALASGRADALRAATQDRLHQDRRLERVPDSRTAIEAALGAGAWCAWLSGSGPSVATLCPPGEVAAAVAAAMPGSGRAVELAIDTEGARVL